MKRMIFTVLLAVFVCCSLTVISAELLWENTAGDRVPDRAILRFLRKAFDHARGAMAYLEGFSLKELRERMGEEAWTMD